MAEFESLRGPALAGRRDRNAIGPDSALGADITRMADLDDQTHRLDRESKMQDLAQRVARIGCWEIDARSARVWLSPELQRLLEAPAGDYQPSVKDFVRLLSAPGTQSIASAVEAAVDRGTPFDLDVRLLSMTGRPLWVRVVGHRDEPVEEGVRVFGVVQNITEQHLLEQAVVDGPRQVRRRITLDLHDGLEQKLTEIEACVRTISESARAENPPLVAKLELVADRVRDATSVCRSVAHGLMPVTQSHGGLIPAFEKLLARTRLQDKVEATLQLSGADALALPEATAEHLYQIAQHAVTNAVGARATHVALDLEVQRHQLKLSVSSSGSDLHAAQPGGEAALGFMRLRARLIGGTLRVSGARAGRTRVTCILRRSGASQVNDRSL